MKKYYLSLRRDGRCIGYVVVNIYKPYDKKINANKIPNIVDDFMEYEIIRIEEI